MSPIAKEGSQMEQEEEKHDINFSLSDCNGKLTDMILIMWILIEICTDDPPVDL